MLGEKCTATSYEKRRPSYLWREAWSSLTENDRLFSGTVLIIGLNFASITSFTPHRLAC